MTTHRYQLRISGLAEDEGRIKAVDAATAHASGSALLSTDTDFTHLHDIWFSFAYIDQKRRLLPE